jgi:hypothetical protein
MDDPLHSARVKLARANLHERTARREAVRFFNSHPAPAFGVEPEDNFDPSDAVGTVKRGRLIFKTAPPELPASFSARFADAIYNYRCVLDHIAWQLVRHGSSWPLPKGARNLVQFPIYDTTNAFTSNQGRRLPGVNKAALRFIKARHKYVGGNATNNALLGLARLCNDDKHRELRLFNSVFRTIETGVTFTRCEPISWDNPPQRPRLEQGAVVALFSWRITGPDPKVQMKLTPAVQIVDEQWRDFSEMLQGIKTEVTEILDAPEILAAVGQQA